ncbi:M20/M25/M40 family metallo-hydrolase [Cellulophaga lytica]|uniref:M28 family metallopeptidase n=1 Tax=Cellulophaga lytica TaxID=979 RepID=UPI0026E4336B|nr:M28 family peptidase [Cellulophaga lytica]MDO6853381.1 M20/M25/M40 family metallo-hydrolase [Cellulophaga lytica]
MKKTFYFLGLLAVVSCSSVAQNTAVKESVTEATEADIKKIVSFLASDDLQGRMSGSDGIAEAATFIENNFKTNGVKPFFKTYKDTLSNFDSSKGVAYNVVGLVEGNDPKLKKEFIIIGAHYDHIGTAKADGDDVIANGANDNASGTAAVMEFARYFGKTKSNKRSIIFALFSAEEMGLLGSKHLAKKLKGDNLNLYTMLNFEMIGIPMQNKDYLAYLTGFNKSNLASVTNTYAGEKIAGFLPKAGDFRLFMRSDNYPFHNEFNVPSQTYSTFDFTNFDHYHKVGDEPSVMDFNHMASLINKFAPIIKSIANSDTKEIQYN